MLCTYYIRSIFLLFIVVSVLFRKQMCNVKSPLLIFIMMSSAVYLSSKEFKAHPWLVHKGKPFRVPYAGVSCLRDVFPVSGEAPASASPHPLTSSGNHGLRRLAPPRVLTGRLVAGGSIGTPLDSVPQGVPGECLFLLTLVM